MPVVVPRRPVHRPGGPHRQGRALPRRQSRLARPSVAYTALVSNRDETQIASPDRGPTTSGLPVLVLRAHRPHLVIPRRVPCPSGLRRPGDALPSCHGPSVRARHDHHRHGRPTTTRHDRQRRDVPVGQASARRRRTGADLGHTHPHRKPHAGSGSACVGLAPVPIALKFATRAGTSSPKSAGSPTARSRGSDETAVWLSCELEPARRRPPSSSAGCTPPTPTPTEPLTCHRRSLAPTPRTTEISLVGSEFSYPEQVSQPRPSIGTRLRWAPPLPGASPAGELARRIDVSPATIQPARERQRPPHRQAPGRNRRVVLDAAGPVQSSPPPRREDSATRPSHDEERRLAHRSRQLAAIEPLC